MTEPSARQAYLADHSEQAGVAEMMGRFVHALRDVFGEDDPALIVQILAAFERRGIAVAPLLLIRTCEIYGSAVLTQSESGYGVLNPDDWELVVHHHR